jgi:hypothetical protein
MLREVFAASPFFVSVSDWVFVFDGGAAVLVDQ